MYFREAKYLVTWPSPCTVNCSYIISFVGPAYQCVDLGPLESSPLNITELAAGSPLDEANGAAPPFINSSLLYYGIDDWGDESRPMGLWVVYDGLNRTVRCILYNATYTTNVSYINNAQYIQNDIMFHSSIKNVQALQAEMQAATENGTIITDVNDWPSLNLFAIHEFSRTFLVGWIAQEGVTLQVGSQVSIWGGVANWSTNYLEFPDDLPTKIQDYMTNVSLSLIDLRNYPIDTTYLNITSQPIVETITLATMTSYPAVYAYSPVADLCHRSRSQHDLYDGR